MANETFSRLKRIQDQFHAFLEERGIGREDDTRRHWLLRFAHFWLLVGKSFIRNRCPVRASALAYTTLLALIPMLAVGVSISTSLLQKIGEQPVRQEIKRMITLLIEKVAPALNLETKSDAGSSGKGIDEVVTQIVDFITKIESGALGLTGTIALVFVAIGLLRTIEAAFNDIWGVTSGRGWIASIVQYWATISLGPIVLLVVLALNASPHLQKTHALLNLWPWVGAVISHLLPFLVLSLAFGLFYLLMPNTRVQWQAALVGGAVGGTLWQLNNILSVVYASQAVSYSKIYGPLSIIPLFLVGIYFSWLILLFGAQVAYAYQNRQSYLQEKQAEGVNQRGREFITLRIMTHLVQHFQGGQKPPDVNSIAAALGVPTRLVSQLLKSLLMAELIVEVLGREIGYAPARPPAQITAHDVLQALRAGQGLELETSDDGARKPVRATFQNIYNAEQTVAGSVTLETLASEASSVQAG